LRLVSKNLMDCEFQIRKSQHIWLRAINRQNGAGQEEGR
jgi:hypothetical protein